MTAITDENGPDVEICWMTAPRAVVQEFLRRHGETDYSFELADSRVVLLLRGCRVSHVNDLLVWCRGKGSVIVCKAVEAPFIQGHATLKGLMPKSSHHGRVVSYWATDRRVVVDAAPIESKAATIQWGARHPESRVRMFSKRDSGGNKRAMVEVDYIEYPRWYWLVWTEQSGVLQPVTNGKWKSIKRDCIEDGVVFRTMFEGAQLGFERRSAGAIA